MFVFFFKEEQASWGGGKGELTNSEGVLIIILYGL